MDTETTVRDGGPRSPTLQEVPTEPEPAPPSRESVASTVTGDARADPTLNISPQFNPNMPPPPPETPPEAKPVTNLVLAPEAEAKTGPIRAPPKILNPGEAARAGAPGEPPPGRTEGGIKARKAPAPTVQDVMGADARAKQIAQQREDQQRQAAAERLAANRAQSSSAPAVASKAPGTPSKAPGTPPAIGAPLRGARTPTGTNPGTPGRGTRTGSRSPLRGDGSRRDRGDRGDRGDRDGSRRRN